MKVLKLCQAQRRVVFASCGVQLLQKRKFLSVFVLLFILAASPSAFADKYSGGTGTASNPYRISTPEDLVELSSSFASSRATLTATYYVLTNDIDMSGVTA